MKKNIPIIFHVVFLFTIALLAFSVIYFNLGIRYAFEKTGEYEKEKEKDFKEEGKADEAFEWWYNQRALPFSLIPADGFQKAFTYTRTTMAEQTRLRKNNSVETGIWESIGPDNVGGRVLAVEIDPRNSSVIWAGSASGGLWKSTTGGKGAAAWELIKTNFPLLSVSTICIDPVNPDIMLIGTGEISVYNVGQVGTPGARTTYGLGILRSSDGGKTWDTTGMNWHFSLNRSVQKIVVNPKNPKVYYAGTSEGTYKSVDGGKKWTLVHDVLMSMDVAINPVDTGIVYTTCGQRNSSPNPGLYKSTDGGTIWIKLTSGLPASNYGRASLAVSRSNDSVVYASIANASTHQLDGLYRTTNRGTTWTKAALTNYLGSQGWYDNVIAVSPVNKDLVLAAGIDIYKSTNGASSITQKSYWYKYYDGVVPAGSPEGPADYAHADHHAIVFDPNNPLRVIIGTDGGVFESTNAGETFAGRNGGFVTTQIYNGFVNAATDSLTALAGLQDNGTLLYEGRPSWNKTYGGDGGWCAIDAKNKLVMYEEYVYCAISKTTDGGVNWNGIFFSNADSANFIAPFVLSPSNSNVLYAGTKKVHKSTDAGKTWRTTKSDSMLNGTVLSCLAVSCTHHDTALAATGSRTAPKFEVFWTTNGGTHWTKTASLLPDRYPTDLAFAPTDSKKAVAVFSGYGTSHVFASADAGKSWTNISSNLPDIPVQSAAFDPASSQHIYIGTDLGVFRTTDGGKVWEEYNNGLPPAMVLEVDFSIQDRRLRAATFGNGVYQRKIPKPGTVNAVPEDGAVPTAFLLEQNYPNPFNPSTTIHYAIPQSGATSLRLYDISGKEIAALVNENLAAGKYSTQWDASGYASGIYFCRLTAGTLSEVRKMIVVK